MIDSTAPHDVLDSDPPSDTEDVAKLRLKLNHLSLPELEAKGLVEWDKEEDTVTEGPQFDKKILE